MILLLLIILIEFLLFNLYISWQQAKRQETGSFILRVVSFISLLFRTTISSSIISILIYRLPILWGLPLDPTFKVFLACLTIFISMAASWFISLNLDSSSSGQNYHPIFVFVSISFSTLLTLWTIGFLSVEFVSISLGAEMCSIITCVSSNDLSIAPLPNPSISEYNEFVRIIFIGLTRLAEESDTLVLTLCPLFCGSGGFVITLLKLYQNRKK